MFLIPGKQNGENKQIITDRGVVVNTIEIKNDTVQTFILLTGRLQPENKIEIYSEVAGILMTGEKPFKIGIHFKENQVIARINKDEARQNLIAQKSTFLNALSNVVPDLKIDYPSIYEEWKDYLLKIDLNRKLPPLPNVENEQQKLFLMGRNIYSQYYNLKQLETRLDKYIIRAPFTGTITSVAINEGTLVRMGQLLGEFIKAGIFELEAAVTLEELPYIKQGDTVIMQLVTNGYEKEYTGEINRINQQVNPATQTVKVFIKVQDPNLKSGMYLEGKVKAKTFLNAIELPRSILLDENKLYIIRDSIAMLKQVEIARLSGQNAVVKGLEDGTLVITDDRSQAFEGTKVIPATPK